MRSASGGAGRLVVGVLLLVVAAAAWVILFRDASSMSMHAPGASPSLAEGTRFTAQWGVMMAAMMIPGAMPMFLLYRTVSQRLVAEGERAVPVAAFVAVYLVIWTLTGIPVYGAYVAVGSIAERWHSFHAAMPYMVAAVLAAAGVYQFTSAKRACLRHCESPLAFLMRRWRSGYPASLRLAASHAGYCIGCCWGLMAILVVAGAMSITWVLAIAVVVFAEKVLPRGWWTARLVGIALIALALAVALRPSLARVMRPQMNDGAMGGLTVNSF